jgi:polyhydroxyalkanoate synthase
MTDTTAKLMKIHHTLSKTEEVEVVSRQKKLFYRQDKLKLFRYDPETMPQHKPPVLIVYKLVSRYNILDLQSENIEIKNLLGLEFGINKIDWEYPSKAYVFLSTTDYMNCYINNCLNSIYIDDKIQCISIVSDRECKSSSSIYAHKVKNTITTISSGDFSVNEDLLFRLSKDKAYDNILDESYTFIPIEFRYVDYEILKPMNKINKKRYFSYNFG